MSIDNELDMIKNEPQIGEMRDAIHDGIKKGYDKSVEAELNSAEAISVTNNLLDGTFDSAVLQSDFENKLNTEINNLQPDFNLFKGNITDEINEINEDFSNLDNKVTGTKSILDFENLVIDKGLETEDWKDAFEAAAQFLRDSVLIKRLVFPAGIYQYSVSPNWVLSNSSIETDGVVRLRYTGTETGFIVDAGESTGLAWNMTIGTFFMEVPSTAKDAMFVRGVHASNIKVKILGAGAEYAGLRTEWCVCTDFYVTVSNNHEGWYLGSKPKYGIYIDKRALQPEGQGGYTSWCSFYTPKVEGCLIGIHIEKGQGNSFYSGTSEGNSDTGIYCSEFALYNKFFGIDLEANTNYDIHCSGNENEFYSVDATNKHLFDTDAKNNLITGGSHNAIELGVDTFGNILQSVKYNRFGNGSILNDKSGKNRLVNNRNVGLNRSENRPPATTAINVGNSPYTYVNNGGNDERIFLSYSAATVSKILYIHGGVGSTYSTDTVTRDILLAPGDSLQVTYSTAPAMYKITT